MDLPEIIPGSYLAQSLHCFRSGPFHDAFENEQCALLMQSGFFKMAEQPEDPSAPENRTMEGLDRIVTRALGNMDRRFIRDEDVARSWWYYGQALRAMGQPMRGLTQCILSSTDGGEGLILSFMIKIQGSKALREANAITDVGSYSPVHFVRLPLEVRDEIYRYLLCARRNDSLTTGVATSASDPYAWKLETAILCTNTQIYEEARKILHEENHFVVLNLDPATFKSLKPSIWPGKPKRNISVPNAVMRIDFTPCTANGDEKATNGCVLLVEQLQDFCINLGMYRAWGVHAKGNDECTVTMARPRRGKHGLMVEQGEPGFMNALTKFRNFPNATVYDSLGRKRTDVECYMKENEFSAAQVLDMIDEIIATADTYMTDKHYSSAVSYLGWCSAILSHLGEQNVDTSTAYLDYIIRYPRFFDSKATLRMAMTVVSLDLKLALACIHCRCFDRAERAAQHALNQLKFMMDMSTDDEDYDEYPHFISRGTDWKQSILTPTLHMTADRIFDSGFNMVDDLIRACSYHAYARHAAAGFPQSWGDLEARERDFAFALAWEYDGY